MQGPPDRMAREVVDPNDVDAMWLWEHDQYVKFRLSEHDSYRRCQPDVTLQPDQMAEYFETGAVT